MNEPVIQITSCEVEVTEVGIELEDMPPFFRRLFGSANAEAQIGGMSRKLSHLIGRVGNLDAFINEN
jgi:hypothetical protein